MLISFFADESGAITVDWVVLTASIVGIAIAVLLVLASGIQSASGNVATGLENAESVAGLIGAAGLSLGDFNEGESHHGHTHYYDTETNDRYQLDPDGQMYDNSGQLFGSVGEDGNITEV